MVRFHLLHPGEFLFEVILFTFGDADSQVLVWVVSTPGGVSIQYLLVVSNNAFK